MKNNQTYSGTIVLDKPLRIKGKEFKTWLHGWDKNDKAKGKCMSAHGTADYSDEHAYTLTRKDLYKFFQAKITSEHPQM